ncbi:MAG TPA: diguanylate cyclase [Polyangiales bacterium]|nr:diguanylate cyclase [Polyangiales bacterium]
MLAEVAKPSKREPSKPLAVVAARIVQEALNEDVDFATLARLAGSDPGFAARVVATVNSGAFGMSRQVSDVTQACKLIGVRGLRNLALSLVVSDMVPVGEDGAVLLANSLRRAVAARLIAEAIGERSLDEFFTMGLFLEIGILHGARTELAVSGEIARMPSAHRPAYERACGRQEHMHIGAALARSFKLPTEMGDAVLHHHAPAPPATGTLVRVGWAAERIAGAFEAADLERGREDAFAAAKAIGVPLAAVEGILARVPELVSETASAFNRELPTQESLESLVQDANRRLVDMNRTYERLLHQLEQLVSEKEQLTTQLRHVNDELSRLAGTDSLTGLANRRVFVDALRRDLSRAQRTSQPLSVLILDVDHFKSVNDTYGHAVGDVVLTRLAEVLRSTLRNGDLAARWGGEEFVALLPGSAIDGAKIAAERIRTALEQVEMSAPVANFRVTASFGVATIPVGAATPQEAPTLMERADAALYEAKRGGRNKVVAAP